MQNKPAAQVQGSVRRGKAGTIAPPRRWILLHHSRAFPKRSQQMDVRNPNPDSTAPRPVKSTNEARQGIAGQNVRTVLIVGISAIVIIFALLWLFYFGR
jgi:hypothetical protein